ncbi:50S ribosomal protein L21 [Candidatus Aerophobetes bacterium]|nr:50S ribosomal protein L21 [Candidatus Aerophobetes bacterium]
MMAVVEIAGKQYRVQPENHIKVDKISAEIGEELFFDKVLMAKKEEGELEIGTPFLEKVKVKAKVLDQARDKKVIVYKFKRRKNYHRKYGHRQSFTSLKIEEILWEGGE